MAFIRRKSGVYHDDVYYEDFEPQRRRRLSKPNTKSIKDLSSTSLLSIRASSNTVDIVDVPDVSPSKIHSMSSAVALLTARFEKAPNVVLSQISLASIKSPAEAGPNNSDSPNTFESHKPSLSSLISKDYQRGEHSQSTTPGTSSLEQIVEDHAPPPRREASFIPGMATRVASYQEERSVPVNTSRQSKSKRNSKDSSGATMNLSEAQLLETWKPPPAEDRPSTPLNLEYGNILGSLRVANGAVSPAPSNLLLSNATIVHTTLKRDTSSVYPESEIGTLRSKRNDSRKDSRKRVISNRSNVARINPHRAFSFTPEVEQHFNEQDAIRPETDKTNDSQANQLAKDYIAELARTPFASPSPPGSPVLGSQDVATVDEPVFLIETINGTTQEDSEAMALGLSQSQGSVRRFPDRAGARSFVDEVNEVRPTTYSMEANPPAQIPVRQESPASFFSVSDSHDDRYEQFSSAVELQASRSTSPIKSPLRQVVTGEDMHKRGPRNKLSDSGYSSNESFGRFPRHEAVEDYRPSQDRTKLLIRKPLQTSFQPVLVHQEVTKPLAAPAIATIEIPTASNSSASLHNQVSEEKEIDSANKASASSTDSKDKARNKLKKLQRKSAKDRIAHPVVQRLASVESFSVPPVSSAARSNLAMRAQAFPELNRTFKTQEHTGPNPNASSLSLVPQSQAVQFPSPKPKEEEEEERPGRSKEKTKSRRRSISRPRSWFGWSKEEKREQQSPAVEVFQVSSLAALGDVIDALGSNPYDMAHKSVMGASPSSSRDDAIRPMPQQRRTTPSNITNNAAVAKPMMDDATAARFSQMRRLSRSESKSSTAPVFNDRGGIPGKLPHATRLSPDAPPLPPMPTSEEINNRLSLRLGNVAAPDVDSFEPHREPENALDKDGEPPMPPPHSPRPTYIEESNEKMPGYFSRSTTPAAVQQEADYSSTVGLNGHVQDEEVVPVPPPHSPAPQTLDRDGRSREVSWTDPADVWRERARSASANLRQSWFERDTGSSHGQWSYEDYYGEPQPQGEIYPHSTQSHDYYGSGYDVYQGHAYAQPRHYPDTHGSHPHEQYFYDQHQWQPNSHIGPRYYLPHAVTWSGNDWAQQGYDNNNKHAGRYYAEHLQHRPQAPTQRHSYHATRSHWAETISTHRYRPQSRENTSRPSSRHRSSRPSSRHSGTSRPTSRHSQSSRRPLAYESQPDHEEHQGRRHSNIEHMPHLGRYSGGLEYTHHSSGARSVSTAKKSSRQRNSWLDMESYGLDMNDVSAMQVPIGVNGSRMIYR